MGVPSFFKWISRKYPKIISPVIEETPDIVDGVKLPIDYCSANPNGELDNLYLDMNGIVHPCSHPENKAAPETEDEMLLAIFEYTNRVLNMARPRKVLMIAVDGVAPRAKMNQQRSRRFRNARDAKIAEEEKARVLAEREAYGEVIDESIKIKRIWDSNAITPGTPFMDKLAAALRYWSAFKLATDPGWKNLQVIISDATVPGEGEHKIMNFIRSQRSDNEYNSNTLHCIYGLDADLIFLGLATHEPHFRILREDVFAQDNRRKIRPNDFINISEERKQVLSENDAEKPFIWLHINVLREYLSTELFVQRLPFPFDLERAIDDWVFMCFFCGNDFLPHLPCLDVRENSIDILVDIWKNLLPSMKTYLTCNGTLNLPGVKKMLEHLGKREPDLFKRKHEQELRKKEAQDRRKMLRRNQNVTQGKVDRNFITPMKYMPIYNVDGTAADGSLKLSNKDLAAMRKEWNLANEGDINSMNALKYKAQENAKREGSEFSPDELRTAVDVSKTGNVFAAESLRERIRSKKRKLAENDSRTAEPITTQLKPTITGETENESQIDEISNIDNCEFVRPEVRSGSGFIDTDTNVCLFEPGYHTRYYQAKFYVEEKDIDTLRKDLARHYIEGVSWVLLYYYQGCSSWTWYYPYHYSPFASDFTDIANLKIEFELGEPFLPFEQLMSVLPAASGHNLPPVLRELMHNPDSEIIDFYPQEFAIDMNGEQMSWKGLSLLPFIDQNRLQFAVRRLYDRLTQEERARNVQRENVMIISNRNVNYERFLNHLYYPNNSTDTSKPFVVFKHARSGLSGTVYPDVEGFCPNTKLVCPLSAGNLPEISTNLFLKLFYKMPEVSSISSKALLLNGYIPPESQLTPTDREAIIYKYPQRWNPQFMKNNVVPVGPAACTQYIPRVGGYRAFIFHQQLMQSEHMYGPGGYLNRSNNNNHSYQAHTIDQFNGCHRRHYHR